MTINHKNLVKRDNNLNNLELMSQQENNQLKSNIKLDKSKVLDIRKSKLSSNVLAQIYNVHHRTIERVRSKDRWANI
jgi:DNA-binding transcriptional regulator YiaG